MQTYRQFKQAATPWQDMMNMSPAEAYGAYKNNVAELDARRDRENMGPLEYLTEYSKMHEDIAGPNNDFPGSPGYDWGLHILNGIEDPEEREQWLSNLRGWNIVSDENTESFMNSSNWGYKPPDPIPPGPVRGATSNSGNVTAYGYTNEPSMNPEQMATDALSNFQSPRTTNGRRYGRNLVGSPYVTLPGYKPGNREKIGQAPSTPTVKQNAPIQSVNPQQPTQGQIKMQSYSEFRKLAEDFTANEQHARDERLRRTQALAGLRDGLWGEHEEVEDAIIDAKKSIKETADFYENQYLPWQKKFYAEHPEQHNQNSASWYSSLVSAAKNNPRATSALAALAAAGLIYGSGYKKKQKKRDYTTDILLSLLGGGAAYWGMNKLLGSGQSTKTTA